MMTSFTVTATSVIRDLAGLDMMFAASAMFGLPALPFLLKLKRFETRPAPVVTKGGKE